MSKTRKIIMGVVFALIVVMGVSVGSSNVNAASTKNFKGNLNATYKNSEWKSKITFKKINTKKVSVKVVVSGLNQGSYRGTIAPRNTIKMKLDGGETINLKWKGKSSFTAKPTKGFSSESVQMLRLLCKSLNNTKYTQVKKSNMVYYSPYYIEKYNSAGNGSNSASVKLKGNKLIVKGGLLKGTKKKYGEASGKVTKLKKTTRTFKIDKNFKVYGNGGENPRPDKGTKSDINVCGSNGLGFVITVKNGKTVRIDFYS